MKMRYGEQVTLIESPMRSELGPVGYSQISSKSFSISSSSSSSSILKAKILEGHAAVDFDIRFHSTF